MANFEDTNGKDKDDVLNKLHQITLPFDKENVTKWIRRLEIKMATFNIKSQWNKRVVLEANLPAEVVDEMDSLFAKEQSEIAEEELIYKDLKVMLIKLHGPKKDADFKVARNFVLTLGQTPSSAAKKLVQLICKQKTPLTNCCCAAAVSSFWRDLLPDPVRQAVASMDLGENFTQTVETADAVWNTLQSSIKIAAIAQPAQPTPATTTAPAAAATEVAAYQTGRGRPWQQRGGQQRGRRGQPRRKRPDPKDRSTWGPAHPDGPTTQHCMQHWMYGKSAHFCRLPTCPWKNITSPPNDNM